MDTVLWVLVAYYVGLVGLLVGTRVRRAETGGAKHADPHEVGV